MSQSEPMPATTSARAVSTGQQLLSDRASAGSSSAIRDLLDRAKQPGMISLAGGLPDASLFPNEQLASIAANAISKDGHALLQYGTTQGSPAARAGLTSMFDDGADPDQLIVTTGSQQALDLIARVVVNPGDQVVVSDPDYLGALQVFRSHGADVRPIAIDTDGLDTEQLEDELRWGLRPKCCYVVPHFHNPTGVTMSLERQRHLHELSTKYGFLVIEDDPYRELFYGDAERAHGGGGSLELVAQLRSASKTLAPGLRIGAMLVPRWLLDPIVVAKQSCDVHTSSLSQEIAAQAINAPWYAGHVERLRGTYREKRDVLASALSTSFDQSVEFTIPGGGMFLWVKFPQLDTTQWLGECLERNVCFVPGTAFAVSRDLSNYARLSFATAAPSELHEAVARMAGCH